MVGIYKILNKETGEFYIGSSTNVEQRWYFHKLHLRKTGFFDCAWNITNKNLDNYEFIILEECDIDDLNNRENYYIKNSDPSLIINVKTGIEQKSHRSFNHMIGKHWYNNGEISKVFYENEVPEGWVIGRITGIDGLKNSPKDTLRKGTEAYNRFLFNLNPHSEYIDTSDMDIKILSKNEFVPLKGILINNKKASSPMVQITYLSEFGSKRALNVTEDHPLLTNHGRKYAIDLTSDDILYNSKTMEEYKIIEVIRNNTKCETYDVETENDLFDLSGIVSHNCRTRVFENLHGEKTSVGRGNLSFSTINIVKLAILSMKKFPNNEEERINYFFELLDKYTDIGAEQLYKRFEFQCEARAYQFPLLMKGMWNGSEKLKSTDEVREVLKQGTLGLGFIGLAECLIALTGHHHGESEKSQELGLKIVGFINDKCQQYKKKYNLNYACLATPAEGLSGKFTKKDKAEFGEIKGITDKDYYTNSNHVPVYYKIGIEDKIKIEAPYHKLTLGGHIMYIELDGDVTKNVSVVEKIVDLYDKYDVGYGSINFVRSRCLDCGFENTDKNLKECPKCGSNNVDTIERITGYLVGSVNAQWNSGKIAELKDRVSHSSGEKMYNK